MAENTEPSKKRLTDFANCAGCGAKLAPLGIAQILRELPKGPFNANLLVGTETSDDAGVFRIAPNLALVQTVDFFPPLVDDPFTFGQIAATNALSDVFAMNGQPITALNIVGFPDDQLPVEILSEILRGAALKVIEAGAVTIGGHSIRDTEIKFGLSVTGLVHPDEVLTNATACAGDLLVLTKPLGTGFVNTANKRGVVTEQALNEAVASMTQLNRVGRDAVRAVGLDKVHALTDVTGFGLTGHALEMAEGANLTVVLDTRALPLLEGARAFADPKFHSRANKSNREFLEGRSKIDPNADPTGIEFAFDPQTSGGLLIAVEASSVEHLQAELRSRGAIASALVGRVEPRQGEIAVHLI